MRTTMLCTLLIALVAAPAFAYSPAQYNWQLRTGYVNHAVSVVQGELLQAKEFVRDATSGARQVVDGGRETYERVRTYGIAGVSSHAAESVTEAQREISQTVAQVQDEKHGFFQDMKDKAKEQVTLTVDRTMITVKQRTQGVRNLVDEIEAKIFGILQRNGFGFRGR